MATLQAAVCSVAQMTCSTVSSSSRSISSEVVSWLCPSSKFSTQLQISSVSSFSQFTSILHNSSVESQVRTESLLLPRKVAEARAAAAGNFINTNSGARAVFEFWVRIKKGVVSVGLAAAVAFAQFPVAPAFASAEPVYTELGVLISGPPIKDANALLRYALPISNKPIKEIQKTLEGITDALKLPGVKAIDPVERDVRQASRLFNQNKDAIFSDVAASRKEEAKTAMSKLSDALLEFQDLLAQKDRAGILPKQKECLECVGNIEEAMVEGFPFEIPAEYAKMPLLKGRAKVEMKVRVKDNPNLRNAVFEMTVDGYNAPVTAGNFIDLVERRFYDNMEIQRADGFVVQTGDPDGPAEGFVDPETGKIRTIPLEITVEGVKEPIYGGTLEELGRFREQTKLPFNAFGTLAMAREEFEPDSASSQIFWLLKESELTPSNANILDGTYAVFGYITENQEYLADLKVGDVIESMRVTSGLDNLVNPSYKVGGA